MANVVVWKSPLKGVGLEEVFVTVGARFIHVDFLPDGILYVWYILDPAGRTEKRKLLTVIDSITTRIEVMLYIGSATRRSPMSSQKLHVFEVPLSTPDKAVG